MGVVQVPSIASGQATLATLANLSDADLDKPTEGNMARGLISVASPLGSALVDRQAGDTVTFKTPAGERQATLVSVS